MKKFFEKFFQPKSGDGSKKVSNKLGYIIILGLIGILLIFLNNILTTSSEETEMDKSIGQQPQQKNVEVSNSEGNDRTSDVQELEKSFKEDLEEMLNKIKGVSDAEVMVNLASSNVQVFEKNIIKGQQTTDETDKNGGLRKVEDQTEETQIVFVRQGDREVPLLVKTEKPEVSGVFVVAKGADHATVKKWIVEAVSRVLDVPTHKVSVMPKTN
ncbi:stage III sporulation protein AG [Oceanobacillus caeni]|uniref:Stage III sporulation protein AG n=1 Tax=Oceanobacillus caeni TaxID=405946 RepID=A0ABR5MKP1_9BACI|nr:MULTISPECIES: stage III sporulation protein AG [Bacillaceae]KKE80660.1 stage III sporulation protein AG [Bacilli bacterium VT-13-104]PZD85315.1 stage III sporulation protein AG [Bacilli bacterium]KPH76408.1 stage III sporulation protein AG [Oceanobacillus caeni]MBU8789822.1 stage III sporulation protein AG [Oceanobacillus caeni]MCR1834932.1 stage III sporulation protein AG [Oceanobacillus caeni]